MGLQAAGEDVQHAALERLVPVGCAAHLFGQRHHLVDLALQQGTQAGHFGHAAVVREVHAGRVVREHAVDRCVQRRRVELNGRRRRQDEGALLGVQFAVAQAEGVAGEPAARLRVPDAVVVPGVARGVGEVQRPAGQVQRHAVVRGVHAVRGHGHQFAVGAFHLRLAIDREGALPQRRRVDHVPDTARMHPQQCVRQCLHQQAAAAGVVQVHMGGDDPVDRVARQAQGLKRRQQPRHGEVGATVDEGGPPFMHQQVGGVEAVAVKAGVHGVDAVAQRLQEGGQGVHGRHSAGGRGCARGAQVTECPGSPTGAPRRRHHRCL